MIRRKKLLSVCFAAYILPLALAQQAFAHVESISTLRIAVEPKGVRLTLTLATRDLSTWFPPSPPSPYMSMVVEGLRKEAPTLFTLKLDGATVGATETTVTSPKTGSVDVVLFFPVAAPPQSLQLACNHLARLPAAHHQLLFVEDDRIAHAQEADVPVLAEDSFTVDQLTYSLDIPALKP